MARGVQFCPRVGAKWFNSICFLFSLYLKNKIIYSYIFVVEYIHCHSLKIPAKYDNRLDIFKWDQFFLSYAILPRLPLYVHSKSYADQGN